MMVTTCESVTARGRSEVSAPSRSRTSSNGTQILSQSVQPARISSFRLVQAQVDCPRAVFVLMGHIGSPGDDIGVAALHTS